MQLPSYFLSMANNQYFSTVSADMLSQCSGTFTKFYPFTVQLTSRASHSCISAIFYNQKDLVQKLCDFRFLMNTLKSTITELTPSSILLYRTKMLALCGQQIVNGCAFCVVQLPCMSSASTDAQLLPARMEACENKTDQITILHPVNLALLQHFFSSETYGSIMGHTTFAKPIDIKIPQFKIFSHVFSKVVAKGQQSH